MNRLQWRNLQKNVYVITAAIIIDYVLVYKAGQIILKKIISIPYIIEGLRSKTVLKRIFKV